MSHEMEHEEHVTHRDDNSMRDSSDPDSYRDWAGYVANERQLYTHE